MTEDGPGRVRLSLTQLLGGAVAAMAGSLVASRLGVAGTILGAAVISVVATILTAVNINSMNHVRDRAREARRSLAETRLAEVQRLRSTEAATQDLPPDVTGEALAEAEAADLAELAAIDDEEAHDPAVEHERFAVADRRGYHWGAIAGVSALLFVLAMVGITLVEKVTGESIACSLGGDCDRPTTIPLPNRSPTPTPTSTPTPAPTTSVSPAPSVTVTVTPSPTETASPTPSDSSSGPVLPTPSGTPSIPESPQPEASP